MARRFKNEAPYNCAGFFMMAYAKVRSVRTHGWQGRSRKMRGTESIGADHDLTQGASNVKYEC